MGECGRIRQYPAVIEELKQSGELGWKCQCRPSPYMNNIIEQDHRFVKKRVVASQWFRSVDGVLNAIAGYEAMNIIRKRPDDLAGKKAISLGRRAY
jgi:IS6 family transposase